MNRHFFFLAILSVAICIGQISDTVASEEWFNWTNVEQIPSRMGASGAFAGLLDGYPVVAGGAVSPDIIQSHSGEYHDGIYVLRRDVDATDRWITVGRLKKPLAYGAAVDTPKGLICLGGRGDDGLSDGVFFLRWNGQGKEIAQVTTLPRLPRACEYPAAAVLANRLYVAGGKNDRGATGHFWVLELDSANEAEGRATWRELAAWPGPARFGASLVVQSDGQQDCLFLFGGKSGNKLFKDAYRFDPLADNAKGRWTPLAEMPRATAVAPATPWGESHVLVFSGFDGQDADRMNGSDAESDFNGDILAYHTITDTWISVGDLPPDVAATMAMSWREGLLLSGGESHDGSCATRVVFGQPRPFETSLGPLDYGVLASYLTVLMLVGFYFARREKTSGDFFLGGRRIPWWAAGLSILATQVSSIGFMAIPAKAYATNWVYFAGVGTWFLVVPLVNRAYIPFFRRLNVTSIYEYLELRFHLVVRLFGTLVYTLMQLGRMTIVLCLPALALSTVTGIDKDVCILLMGVICTAYTVAGGIEAVIWTDVVQAVLLLSGGLLCVVMVVVDIEGGPTRFFEIAMADQKFQMVELDWSYATASLWVVLLGSFFMRLGGLTSDQAIVQRYLSTPDEAMAKRALWANVAVGIPWAVVVFMLGTSLYVFYKLHPEMLNANLHTDAVVPLFVAQKIPAGLSGLIIAAVFAAAMSSLDSSLHSVATVWVTDIYARFVPRSCDRSRLNMARLLTLLLGAFGTATAVWMASSGISSLWDQFMSIIGLFIGSITGVFFLGIFTRRTSTIGVMIGALTSAAVLCYVVYFTQVSFFLYSAIGCIVCCVVGYAFSFVWPERKQLDDLTIHDLKSAKYRSDRQK